MREMRGRVKRTTEERGRQIDGGKEVEGEGGGGGYFIISSYPANKK
jgi:hypothetical protein